MDVIECRKALAAALSDHDLDKVRLFLHTSYVVRGTDGVVVLDYEAFVSRLPTFVSRHPNTISRLKSRRRRRSATPQR